MSLIQLLKVLIMLLVEIIQSSYEIRFDNVPAFFKEYPFETIRPRRFVSCNIIDDGFYFVLLKFIFKVC